MQSNGSWDTTSIGDSESISASGWYHAKKLIPKSETETRVDVPVFRGVLNGCVEVDVASQQTQVVDYKPTVTASQQTAKMPQTNSKQTKTKVKNEIPPPPKPKREFEIASGILVEYNGKDDYAVVPEGVVKVGDNAFANAKKFLKRVAFYDDFKEIGDGAFEGCTLLERVDLSRDLTTIGNKAFKGCKNLTKIGYLNKGLPDGLQSIGEEAFVGCDKLTRITLPCGCDAQENAFSSTCRVINPSQTQIVGDFEIEDNTLYKYHGKDENVVVPKGVKDVWLGAFDNAKSVLKSVVLPEGIAEIRHDIFKDCLSLKKVTLPTTLKSIQRDAFSGCKNLEEINFPNGLTNVDQRAFVGCEKLNRTDFPQAFDVMLVDLEAQAKEKQKQFEEQINKQGTFEVKDGVLSKYKGKDKTVFIPDGVTKILPTAFVDKKNVLTEVVVPEGVENIEAYTFAEFKKLTTVILPSTLKQIDEKAFWGCKKLAEINFPDGLKNIDKYAFDGCESLTKAFLPKDCKFYESFWGSFPIKCKIFSDAKPYYVSYNNLIHYRGTSGVAILPKGIQNILLDAFNDAKGYLVEVVVPEGITRLEVNTFENCQSLKKVVLPSTLKIISHSVFKNCPNLEEINFPDGLEYIGRTAFSGCKKITNVVLPSSCNYQTLMEASFDLGCKITQQK